MPSHFSQSSSPSGRVSGSALESLALPIPNGDGGVSNCWPSRLGCLCAGAGRALPRPPTIPRARPLSGLPRGRLLSPLPEGGRGAFPLLLLLLQTLPSGRLLSFWSRDPPLSGLPLYHWRIGNGARVPLAERGLFRCHCPAPSGLSFRSQSCRHTASLRKQYPASLCLKPCHAI